MKKVVITVACLIVLVILAALLAPFFVDLNQYKDEIRGLVRPYLPRDFDFEEIRLTVLPRLGAELRGAVIAERPEFGRHDFFTLDRLQVVVKLRPLLQKQIQVKKLILERPVVRIVRDASGAFNFDDLAGGQAAADASGPEKQPPPDQPAQEPGPGVLGALLVSEFAIRDAGVLFSDLGADDPAFKPVVDRLDLELTDVSLQGPVKISLAAALAGADVQNVSLQGQVSGIPDQPTWDAQLRCSPLSPEELFGALPIFAAFIPADLALKGATALELSTRGNLDDLSADGTLELKDLEVRYSDIVHKSRGTAGSLAFAVGMQGDTIAVAPLTLTVHNAVLTARGNIKNLADPALDLSVASNGFSLDSWDALIPIIAEYKPGGTAKLEGSLRGTLDALSGKGSLRITDGEFASAPFQSIGADMTYSDDTLRIENSSIKAFDGSVTATGAVDFTTFLWEASPEISALDLNAILSALTQYHDIAAGRISGAFTLKETGRQPGGIPDIQGTFAVDKGELKNFSLVDSVVASLSGIKGITGLLTGSVEKAQQFQTTRFDSLEGSLALAGNTVTVRQLSLTNIQTAQATDSEATLKGTAQLDTGEMDLLGAVILAPRHASKLIKKAEPLQALTSKDGRMTLPVKIAGTFDKPRVVLDAAYVANRMAKFYSRKGIDKLSRKLGLEPQKPGKNDQQRVLENLLDDLLQKR